MIAFIGARMIRFALLLLLIIMGGISVSIAFGRSQAISSLVVDVADNQGLRRYHVDTRTGILYEQSQQLRVVETTISPNRQYRVEQIDSVWTLIHIDDDTQHRIGDFFEFEPRIVWSPDSTRMWFMVTQRDKSVIRAYDVMTGEIVHQHFMDTNVYYFKPNQTGDWMLTFTDDSTWRDAGRLVLGGATIIDLQTGDLTRLPEADILSYSIAPDDTWLFTMYYDDAPMRDPTYGLQWFNVADGRTITVPNLAESNVSHSWSPDSRRVVYSMTMDERTFEQDVNWLDLETGEQHDLFTERTDIVVHWSPTGDYIAIENRLRPTSPIQFVELLTGDAMTINREGIHHDIAVNLTGGHLAYSRQVDGHFILYTYNIATDTHRRVITLPRGSYQLRWDKDS